MRERRESVRTATKIRKEQIEKFNVHYMNTGIIRRSLIEDTAGNNMLDNSPQPEFCSNTKMKINPPHQSNCVVNSPDSSARKVSERKTSACKDGHSKNMALDIEIHTPDKRSRANSSPKSPRDHSNPP